MVCKITSTEVVVSEDKFSGLIKGTSAPYFLLISAILSSSVETINLSMNLDYLAASGSDPTIAIYIYTNLNFYLQCEAIIYNNILAIHKF